VGDVEVKIVKIYVFRSNSDLEAATEAGDAHAAGSPVTYNFAARRSHIIMLESMR
jgi:hypothetical protein